jgi:hypothetical protein
MTTVDEIQHHQSQSHHQCVRPLTPFHRKTPSNVPKMMMLAMCEVAGEIVSAHLGRAHAVKKNCNARASASARR